VSRVGDAQQRFQAPQSAVCAPVLGKFDRRPGEVAVTLQLRLEQLEQVKASAVPPANPAITLPSAMRRTLRALPFMMVLPS
jgi:hypothetical protein